MKPVLLGRILFGGAAILYGVIALMWHDADTWQIMAEFWKLPFGKSIGDCLMIAQIAGGLLLMYPRTARASSIILGVIYALFSLTAIPGIIAMPKVYAQWGSFFEQFSLVCGAVAVYAVTTSDAARAAGLGRAARIGLGLCAISFTLGQLVYLRFTASLVPAWIPPNQMFWAVLTTIAFALAAIAILLNSWARLALRLMTVMLALFGVLVWVTLLIAHPDQHGNWSEFAETFQIAGATWMVAELRSF